MMTAAQSFDYAKQIEDPIREDLVLAHRRAWDLLAEPGTWWNGRERVAIAAEARAAADYVAGMTDRFAMSEHAQRRA